MPHKSLHNALYEAKPRQCGLNVREMTLFYVQVNRIIVTQQEWVFEATTHQPRKFGR